MKALLFFLLLFPLIQDNKPCIEILSINAVKTSYGQGEKIKLTINNSSNYKIITSTFSLYQWNENNKAWIKIMYDMIFDSCPTDEDILIHKILPGALIIEANGFTNFIWNPKEIPKKCFDYKENSGTYKIKFIYHVEEGDKILFSDNYETSSFKII